MFFPTGGIKFLATSIICCSTFALATPPRLPPIASKPSSTLAPPTPAPSATISPSPSPTPIPASKREKYILTCQEVRIRTRLFLDLHLLHKEFTDELSRRSFAKFFELLDPERIFLTSEDIEQFRPLEDRLNALIARKNCSFIDAINALLLERIKERSEWLTLLIAKTTNQKLGNQSLADQPLAGQPLAGQSTTKPTWAKTRLELDSKWNQRIETDTQKILKSGFSGAISERLFHRYKKQITHAANRNRDELYSDFLNGFALSLDPHSAHFLPLDQDEFNSRLGNPVDNIGLTFSDDNDTITIETITKNSPAEKAGTLKIGDKLTSIDTMDGSPVLDPSTFDIGKINRLIRGKKDTKIKLTFIRQANETIVVVLRREYSKLKSIKVKSALADVRGHKIGLIRLPAFYTDLECRNRMLTSCQGSAMEVRSELDHLRENRAEGVILDLRNNNGGDLQESIRIAGLFINNGPILQIVDRTGTPRIQMDPDPRISFSGPVLVLINKNSASASEIVAAALKDYGRAIIVGDTRTFGKGTIQVIQDLSSPIAHTREGMLKITQATFYSPNGQSTQKKGVESDIIIPSLTENEVETEAEKDFAIDWSEIPPVPGFKKLQTNTSTEVARLREKSIERISKNQAFQEMINRVKDKNTHTSWKESFADENLSSGSDFQMQEAMEILADSLQG